VPIDPAFWGTVLIEARPASLHPKDLRRGHDASRLHELSDFRVLQKLLASFTIAMRHIQTELGLPVSRSITTTFTPAAVSRGLSASKFGRRFYSRQRDE
jgi:hypothetical protein